MAFEVVKKQREIVRIIGKIIEIDLKLFAKNSNVSIFCMLISAIIFGKIRRFFLGFW